MAPDRLRFDFSHTAPLTDDEKQKVEDLGERARPQERSPPTPPCWRSPDAKLAGAIAFFGEKYGDTVRVVTMGEVGGGVLLAALRDVPLPSTSTSSELTEETGGRLGDRKVEAAADAGARWQIAWKMGVSFISDGNFSPRHGIRGLPRASSTLRTPLGAQLEGLEKNAHFSPSPPGNG